MAQDSGANIKGEMGFCAIMAKKRVSGTKRVYSKKMYLPFSREMDFRYLHGSNPNP